MKLWKIAIILVAIIGVSGGVYYGVSKSVEQKELEEIESIGAKTLFDFDTSDITNVSFVSSSSTLEFSSEDGMNWTCTNDDMTPNSNAILLAVSTMSTLSTNKIIEEDASDLSIYGLDDPIEFSCTDGTNTYQIQIGNPSPTGESYYVKSPDDNDVYTIDYSTGAMLHLEVDDLKNRYILDTYLSTVNKIIYSEGDNVVFNCQKGDDGVWQLIEPEVTGVNVDITKISSIADLLIRADVIDFITDDPTDAELAEYGLDNPKYTIQVGASGMEDSIVYLGDSPQDNVIYVQFADTKQVATFYMGEIGIIGATAQAVLSDNIYSDKLKNITNVTIEYEGQTTELVIDYDSEERSYTYTLNGKTISDSDDDYSMVNRLANSTLGISLYSFQPNEVPEGDPTLTITYTRNYEPEEYSLAFIPTDEDTKYYYVLINGEYTGCMVKARSLTAENQLLYCLDSLLGS